MFLFILLLSVFPMVLAGHPHNLAWSGGPLHMECDHSDFLTRSGQHERDNVIVVKAVTFNDKVYVISPRWKRGVLASVWSLVKARRGVELEPFPEERAHTLGDCSAVQNAVDFYLDHLGHLWLLDTGVIETLEHPKCTCPPKVVVLSIPRAKITKSYPLTSVLPSSLLQNIVVEHGFMKEFVYISDASRGSIIVQDTSSDRQWAVQACAPAVGLQMALVKRGLAHSTLILNRLQNSGLLEIDSDSLKKNSASTVKLHGDQSKPIVLLGSDIHHIYFRHSECGDVLSWDIRDTFNTSGLQNIHSPGPRLLPTSVTAEPLKHTLVVLDSNFAETMNSDSATYHRITFVDKWWL